MTPGQTPRNAFEWLLWGLQVFVWLCVLYVLFVVSSCVVSAYT